MFIVCGEALMDVFAAGHTASGLMLDARIGGSPFNVAIGIARLGQPVSFLGALSNGFLGDRLLEALDVEGVDTGCIERVDAPATLGLVGVDATGQPSYAFYGAGGADRQLSQAALARVPASSRIIHVGSYAMVVEPIASTLRTLVEQRRNDALISYDPNIRLNVEPDLERWRDTLDWMAQRADLLKVSAEDLHLLHGGRPAEDLVHEWLAAGVSLVVITQGAGGVRGWTASQHAVATPPAIDVVDTVGAGDTFQAALLAGLAERGVATARALATLDRATLDGLLRFATSAAAITCTRRGADLPRRSEVTGGG